MFLCFLSSCNKVFKLLYVYEPNKMHKILVIGLYFLLDAVHVSDYINPSSGTTL